MGHHQSPPAFVNLLASFKPTIIDFLHVNRRSRVEESLVGALHQASMTHHHSACAFLSRLLPNKLLRRKMKAIRIVQMLGTTHSDKKRKSLLSSQMLHSG